MQEVSHPNIVRLLSVATGPGAGAIFLVFELCECDLTALIDPPAPRLRLSEVKCIVHQVRTYAFRCFACLFIWLAWLGGGERGGDMCRRW